RARVAHDDTNLYLAVEVDEPAMQSLRAPSRPHDDGDTWKDDCVELFLAPEPGGLTYYQFIVNAAGARYDSCEGGKGLAAAWNAKPDWQATVAKQADRWTAEIAIPFAALGVEKPLRGELWGLKICRSVWGRGGDRREDRNTAWAYTPSPSYHDPAGWGRLYFDAANLLPNGDFSPPPLDNGLPRNWNQQLVWQPDQPATGHVRQIEREGRNVLLLHKNPEAKGSLLPRATSTARARGGRHYRCTASVLAKGTVHLAFSLYSPGKPGYVSTPFTLPPAGEARPYGGKGDGFETITAECDAPAAVTAVAVTFGFDRETTGDLLIRDVVLADLGRPVQKVDVDLRHGLKAAPAALVEMKPYERLRDEQGRYPFERLIFKDTGTGTEIWRITWDFHGANTTYSNMYPWNPNGATFLFSCWERPGQIYFLASPSGDSVRPLDLSPSQAPRWGKDPDLLFYGTRDSIMQFNWRTGEQKALFTIPKGIMQGGRPSIAWNMDLPGAVYYEKAFGTNAPLYFIDLKTGQHIRIPITSDSTGDKEKDWLYSARLSQIRGAWYVGYSLNHLPHLSDKNPYQQRLGTLDGKRGLNRLSLSQPEGKPAQPLYSHGGTQPAGRYECGYHSGGIALWDFEKWEGKMLVPGP
ncbi:MAG: hypothetical protein FJ272_17560, partial [Planctomycetes bacterium]|nr:hypothetical protein [Planctomycetota bacterium]